MAKKPKKSASETLIKSILEDLQSDGEDASSYSEQPDSARELPEGLDSKTAILGKPSTERSPAPQEKSVVQENEIKLPAIPSDPEHSATRRIGHEEPGSNASIRSQSYTDRTQPMVRAMVPSSEPTPTKVSHGLSRPMTKNSASLAASATEAAMMQAENLRMAQSRILDLEKEVELLRQENELLASAGEIAKKRAEEFFEKVQDIERAKVDALEQAQMEMNIYRENSTEKDKQLARMRRNIEDLETRLAKDLKKIRVRERELENRLELSKMEKTALVRAKDEAILDLKNKLDQLHQELESYKLRCSELNQKVDGQHEQLGRTVRALRLALTHLESNDSSGNVMPLKKAE